MVVMPQSGFADDMPQGGLTIRFASKEVLQLPCHRGVHMAVMPRSGLTDNMPQSGLTVSLP